MTLTGLDNDPRKVDSYHTDPRMAKASIHSIYIIKKNYDCDFVLSHVEVITRQLKFIAERKRGVKEQ